MTVLIFAIIVFFCRWTWWGHGWWFRGDFKEGRRGWRCTSPLYTVHIIRSVKTVCSAPSFSEIRSCLFSWGKVSLVFFLVGGRIAWSAWLRICTCVHEARNILLGKWWCSIIAKSFKTSYILSPLIDKCFNYYWFFWKKLAHIADSGAWRRPRSFI